MDSPFVYVNVFVPDSLLIISKSFKQKLPIYGYHCTINSEQAGSQEVQHTLVVSACDNTSTQDQSSPLTILGEIACENCFNSDNNTYTAAKNTKLPVRSDISPSVFSDQSSIDNESDGIKYVFWLLFKSDSFLQVSKVLINGQALSLKNVNVIFYCSEEILEARLLCNKYGSDTTNTSLSFFISKVKHEAQKEQKSSTFSTFYYLCLGSIIYLMKVLLFFPQCCIKIQSFFQRIFDFQSATLTQLHVRVTQLNEMQRINEQMSSKIGQFFPSCLCQCTPKHSLKRNNQARCDKKGYQSHSTSLNKNAPSCDSAQDSHRYLKEPFSCKACPVYGCSNSIDWSCMPATATSDSLVLLRLFFVVLVDAALGISLLLWIQNVGSADIIYDWFLSMAQGVSSAVLQLLTWLKGAPAGLKLNQPLSVALATFFSYHVGLWMLYLEVAGGAVRALCWALVWSGPLGATVQLALLSDLLQLAALHLHCFYVYAARLHMVQISLLGSQWRAFRGNKWNPLKLRVDSLHCQPSPIHQPSGAIRPPCGDTSRAPLSRVLSAIIFTLVLFLLPTTTVYYVVFLSVRVVLVVVREVLRGAAWLLHHNPVFAPCLRLLRPSALRGEVEFESVPGLGERGAPVSLRVGVRCLPLTHVVRHFAASPSLPTFSLPSLSTVASALVYARTLI